MSILPCTTTPLIPSEQEDLCEFKASSIYLVNSRTNQGYVERPCLTKQNDDNDDNNTNIIIDIKGKLTEILKSEEKFRNYYWYLENNFSFVYKCVINFWVTSFSSSPSSDFQYACLKDNIWNQGKSLLSDDYFIVYRKVKLVPCTLVWNLSLVSPASFQFWNFCCYHTAVTELPLGLLHIPWWGFWLWFFILFVCLVWFGSWRQGFSGHPGTPFCRSGCPQTHGDPLASASWVLGLKVCGTTPN